MAARTIAPLPGIPDGRPIAIDQTLAPVKRLILAL
jgi:hypothetical protein